VFGELVGLRELQVEEFGVGFWYCQKIVSKDFLLLLAAAGACAAGAAVHSA
jgi:hypothetical protein